MTDVRLEFPIDRLRGNPSSERVVTDISKRCRRLPESLELLKNLHQHLVMLHNQVAMRPDDAKLRAKYVDVVVRFVKLQHRKSLLMRLAKNETLLHVVYELHLALDDVCRDVGMENHFFMTDWRAGWEKCSAEQPHQLMTRIDSASDRVLVNELEGEKKLQEALMALHSSLNAPGLSPEMKRFKQKTYDRVMKYSRREGMRMFDWFISIEDVEYEDDDIGLGTFGTVSRGTWFHDGERQPVVVKRLFRETAEASDAPFLNQLMLWGGLPDHKHILKLHGGCHVSSPQFYVCEDAHKGNLVDFLALEENRGMFWRMMLQVAEGLAFLHSHNVVHGGLKCNNILVDDDNTAKLGDFGFSSIRTLSMQLSDHKSKMQEQSVRWQPKEMLQESGIQWEARPESDMYSLGMCMIEAMGQEIPFGTMDDESVMDLVLQEAEYPRPDDVTDEAWHLISRLCAPRFQDRPVLKSVLEEIRVLAQQEGAPLGA